MIIQSQKVLKQVPALNELQKEYPTIKTVLFDMDGTLFNTEKYHAEALFKMAKELKLSPPHSPGEVYEMMVGKADHLIFDIIRDWTGFPSDWTAEQFIKIKNQKILEMLQSLSAEAYFHRDLGTLLNQIKNANIQLGLVTSSERIITQELLKLAQIEEYFHFVLTRDDSLKVKPDPWPYIHTMTYFNSSPSETIIFEDSKVGLEAAIASGAYSIKAEWY